MTYLELKDTEYTQLRKKLLRTKGSSLQKQFIKAAIDNDTFIKWIEGQVGIENSNGESFDLFGNRLSEGEYKEPTKLVEEELFRKWSSLEPAQASQETFWGYVTLKHIEKGIIKAPYLAANGGNLSGGLERIEKALKNNDSQVIDSIVRTMLRRMSGLPEARGSKSVYVNCPFARAWWRSYVAQQVCEETQADFDKVYKTLTISQEYWERLIVLIVSRNSVLGDTSVRTALIWALSEFVDDETKSKLFVVATLVQIIQQISIRSAWQELGVLPVKELKLIMNQYIQRSMQ